MADEEYEILPHKLLADLKDDVEALKKKLSEPDNKANELILEIESLKDSVSELNGIFQKTLQEVKGDDDLGKLLRNVVSQNETIAKGMIAISDKLEDFMGKHNTPMQNKMHIPPQPTMNHPNYPQSAPIHHTMGPPSISGSRMAPPPQMMSNDFSGMPGNNGAGVPPPPPRKSSSGERKFNLF